MNIVAPDIRMAAAALARSYYHYSTPHVTVILHILFYLTTPYPFFFQALLMSYL